MGRILRPDLDAVFFILEGPAVDGGEEGLQGLEVRVLGDARLAARPVRAAHHPRRIPAPGPTAARPGRGDPRPAARPPRASYFPARRLPPPRLREISQPFYKFPLR